jgi:hypothetical protein
MGEHLGFFQVLWCPEEAQTFARCEGCFITSELSAMAHAASPGPKLPVRGGRPHSRQTVCISESHPGPDSKRTTARTAQCLSGYGTAVSSTVVTESCTASTPGHEWEPQSCRDLPKAAQLAWPSVLDCGLLGHLSSEHFPCHHSCSFWCPALGRCSGPRFQFSSD